MTTTTDFLLDLLDTFPDLEPALGDRAAAFRDELLAIAGELDGDVAVTALRDRLDAFARRLLAALSGPAAQKLRDVMDQAGIARERTADLDPLSGLEGNEPARPAPVRAMPPPPPPPPPSGGGRGVGAGGGGGRGVGAGAPASLPPGVVVVPVYYGTEPALSGRVRPDVCCSGGRSQDVRVGIARVTVPVEGREVGDLAEPKLWKLEFKPNPAKHVILASIEALERPQFIEALRASFDS